MTPEEKAKELYNKFFKEVPFLTIEDNPKDDSIAAKQCALIAVDEIKEAIFWHPYESPNFELEYWNEVMNELNKL